MVKNQKEGLKKTKFNNYKLKKDFARKYGERLQRRGLLMLGLVILGLCSYQVFCVRSIVLLCCVSLLLFSV